MKRSKGSKEKSWMRSISVRVRPWWRRRRSMVLVQLVLKTQWIIRITSKGSRRQRTSRGAGTRLRLRGWIWIHHWMATTGAIDAACIQCRKVEAWNSRWDCAWTPSASQTAKTPQGAASASRLSNLRPIRSMENVETAAWIQVPTPVNRGTATCRNPMQRIISWGGPTRSTLPAPSTRVVAQCHEQHSARHATKCNRQTTAGAASCIYLELMIEIKNYIIQECFIEIIFF